MAQSFAAASETAAAMPESVPFETARTVIAGLTALEDALSAGLLAQWQRVVHDDPLGSFFQSPEWCLPWYRCYADAYEPHVIVVRGTPGVVGIVPMAVHRESGELAFASNAMADYRDIVALPGYRPAVVSQLVQEYVSGRFPNVLQIGWIDPASDTPALVRAVCRDMGLACTARHQPCWRWFPLEGENLNKRFSRIRTHFNYFKKQGDAAFELIDTAGRWRAFREEFFRQHSLRQLQAGRPVSFLDPRKQRLYDLLFESPASGVHVTALRVNERLVAGHIGVVWRNVLMLGAPAINIEEEQRSPAVILLAWIIQNAETLGLQGFDLTIGESDFKRRLGNRCVELTMMEIYGRRGRYFLDAARARGVAAVRKAVAAIGGAESWEARVKPTAAALGGRWRRAGEDGVWATLGATGRWIAGAVYDVRTDLTCSIAAEQLQPCDRVVSGTYAVHENQINDLLLANDAPPSVAEAVTECARSYARARSAGETLHTLVGPAGLAGWCYSQVAASPEPESTAAAAREPGAAIVHGIYLVPASRTAAAYGALLDAAVRSRLAQGVPLATMVIEKNDRVLRAAAEAVGFRVAAATERRRVFGRSVSSASRAGA